MDNCNFPKPEETNIQDLDGDVTGRPELQEYLEKISQNSESIENINDNIEELDQDIQNLENNKVDVQHNASDSGKVLAIGADGKVILITLSGSDVEIITEVFTVSSPTGSIFGVDISKSGYFPIGVTRFAWDNPTDGFINAGFGISYDSQYLTGYTTTPNKVSGFKATIVYISNSSQNNSNINASFAEEE